MDSSKIERRIFVRIKDNLQTEIITNKNSFTSFTKNISAGGVLCWAAEPISLMSTVRLVLTIPSYKSVVSRKIDCNGMVVRFEPANLYKIQEGYNVAIRFVDINKDDQATIDLYAKEKLKDIV